MTQSSHILSKVAVSASLALGLVMGLNATEVKAAVLGPYNYTNPFTFNVNDLHVTFTGTGGGLTNPVLTNDPPGGSAINITGGNTVNIVAAGGQFLLPNQTWSFTVNSNIVPIQPLAPVWTVNGRAVPEPLTILGTGTALGMSALLKRKLAKKQQKKV